MSVIVSIIIPVYGVEKYIAECIESVFNQSYTDKVECVIVNDCTKDRSMDIVSDMLSDYKGNISFRVINRMTNGGLSAARNTGIKNARGKYVFFLDSDDYLKTDCIDALVKLSVLYPKAQIIQAGLTATNGGFKFLSTEGNRRLKCYSEDSGYIKKHMLQAHYPTVAQNKLILKDWLERNDLFFKEGVLHEDEHWNFYASKYVDSYVLCKRDSYIYRVREGSIMQTIGEKSVLSQIVILRDFLNNIDAKEEQAQRFAIFKMCFRGYLNYSEPYKELMVDVLKRLKIHCSFVGRSVIDIVLCLPNDFFRTRFGVVLGEKIFSRLV